MRIQLADTSIVLSYPTGFGSGEPSSWKFVFGEMLDVDIQCVPLATDIQCVPIATDIQRVPLAIDIQCVPIATDIQRVPLATDIQCVPIATDIQCVPIATDIQRVPLATEPCISLIILTPIKILQRNLNRSAFVV